MMGTPLARSFFLRSPELVAPELLGKLIVRRDAGAVLAGRIVETEAYFGREDPAAHAYSGPTARNRVLFGPPGYAYVYRIYGMHHCLNVSCEPEGDAGCVLIRALEPVAGLARMAELRGLAAGSRSISRQDGERGENLDAALLQGKATPTSAGPLRPIGEMLKPRMLTAGPGRLCQALGISRSAHNGMDVTDAGSELVFADDGAPSPTVWVGPRIGIRVAVDRPARYCVAGSDFLSVRC